MPDATHLCRACGATTLTGKRGRPPLYCSPECQPNRYATRCRAFVCQGCGTIATSPDNRGTPPKWCAACRRRNIRETPCRTCSRTFTTTTCALYCSDQCKPEPKPLGPPRIPKQLTLPLQQDQRSALRRAYERSDHPGVLQAIRANSGVDADTGCWIWQGRSKANYPVTKLIGRTVQVHRLSLEAKHGARLGSQQAHHKCAQPMCVNPDHLQPVTHRDNVAEMHARSAYRARIADLEQALQDLQPGHPLLQMIGTA